MINAGKVAVAVEEQWLRRWPFSRGKWIGKRLNSIANCVGVVRPWWQQIDDVWFELDSEDYICRVLMREGSFEPAICNAITTRLPEGGLFVDVGANIGYTTLMTARKCAGSQVLAFEASPSIAARLKRNVERNGFSNVRVMEAACSDESGMVTIYQGSRDKLGNTSFSASNAGSRTAIRVPAIRLDEIDLVVHRLDVVKIDVEGAELKVLRGMESLLRAFRPVLIIEIIDSHLRQCGCAADDVFNYVAQHGYSWTALGPTDYLCVPAA